MTAVEQVVTASTVTMISRWRRARRRQNARRVDPPVSFHAVSLRMFGGEWYSLRPRLTHRHGSSRRPLPCLCTRRDRGPAALPIVCIIVCLHIDWEVDALRSVSGSPATLQHSSQ